MISVVIPTHNSAHCLRECVESATATLGDCRFVIVDNASSDDTCMIAMTLDIPDRAVELVELPFNAGFGAACNAGVRASSDEVVLLLNPDVLLTETTSDGLASASDSAPYGLRNLTLDAGESSRALDHRERPWWWEVWWKIARPYWPRGFEKRSMAFPVGAKWTHGAAMVLRTSEFELVGGFSDHFFMYAEDRELSSRYREAGLPLGRETSTHGRHAHGKSTANSSELRPVRRAWSLLGWIEFLALTSGQDQATKAASIYFGVSSFIANVALKYGSRFDERFRRKGVETRSLNAFIGEWLDCNLTESNPLSGGDYYPLARLAISDALSSKSWVRRNFQTLVGPAQGDQIQG